MATSKPSVLRRQKRERTIRRSIRSATAGEAIGPITKDCEIYGLTGGQFSLVDVIVHCLEHTGPAHVVVSTWTAASADIDFAMGLMANKSITTLRFVVDRSFPTRQPAYCTALRQRFGDDAVRVTETHAKFVVIHNDEWKVVIRTSMNINHNRRLENFEISEDPVLAEHLLSFVDELFERHESGAQFQKKAGQNLKDFLDMTKTGPTPTEPAACSPTYFDDSPTGRDLRRVGWSTRKGSLQ